MEDFIIPISREDLLKRTSMNQYVVDEVVPIRVIKNHLPDARRYLRERGVDYIFKSFDVIFGILYQFADIETSIKENAWEVVLKGCQACVRRMAEAAEEDMERDDKTQLRNAIKMNTYLLCQFIELFENDLNQATSSSITAKGRGKKKTKQAAAALKLTMDWPDECEHAIQALNQLFKLPVHKLWDPPIVEEDYVNLVSGCCYKLIENPELSKLPGIRSGVSSSLASLCRRHNHNMDCCMKLTQLLHCSPHMVPTLMAIVTSFIEQENLKTLVHDILKEVCSYSGTDLERDSQAAHSISGFLTDFAAVYPQQAQTILPLLKRRLEEDPYTMRNCALGVIGEIVMKIYGNKEQLEQKHRTQRDKLLDVLEEHIHDVNGFVRSKVLTIWLSIVTSGALPVKRQSRLLSLIVGPQGAILDTSCQARRNAIKIITSMISHNPAGKVTYQELNRQLEAEKNKLEELEANQDPAIIQLEQKWNEILKPLQKALMEGALTDENEAKLKEEDTAETVANDIHDMLQQGSYRDAIQTFNQAQEVFSGHIFFNSNVDQPADVDMSEEEVIRRKLQLWIFKMQCIFMGTYKDQIPRVPGNDPATQGTQGGLTQDQVAELLRQRGLVDYLTETVTLLGQIQAALPDVRQMLVSKAPSDALEAIEFFVNGQANGVANMEPGVRKMLSLVWSKEQPIRDAVVQGYRRLFMCSDEENTRPRALKIVASLSKLVSDATLGEILSLEQLVSEFFKDGDMDRSVTQVLWERFTRKIPGTSTRDRKAAIILIGMAANASPDLVKSNVDVLVNEGLYYGPENDLQMVMYTCDVLQKIAVQSKSAEKTVEPFRLPRTHAMFSHLCKIMVTTITNLNDRHWIPMAEQALNTIYCLSEQPDVTCERLIGQLAGLFLTEDKENLTAEGAEGTSQGLLECPSGVLARFVSLCGHVAMKQLIHLDVHVLGELKRRNAVRQEKQESKGDKKKKKNTPHPDASTNKNDTTTAGGDGEEDMGLTGATADDVECEMMRRLCDTELVTGSGNLLSRVAPLVVHVCHNTNRYQEQDLQAAASLSLAKFMLVSSEFCENNLQLLFTLAERSESEVIRANLIVALGDLTKRFPNLLEPWTPHLYARLRDQSPKVRLNALNTLSHLILNDMVKVKGQISEITTCIVDESDRIVHLAKLFFNELAQKGNALYNVMPDIISRLSDPETGIDDKNFKIIMDYLFPFIQKERLCETLVEKLCVRFRTTQNERQWCDLAYCLSVMNYNDKMVQKLLENLMTYFRILHVQEVYAAFVTIISNAKKNVKGGAIATVEELESKIEEFREKVVEDEEAAQNAQKAAADARSKRKSHRKSRGPAKANQSRRQVTQSSGEEEPGPSQQTRVEQGESDEEERVTRTEAAASSSDDAVSPVKRGKKAGPSSAAKVKQEPGRTKRRALRRVFDSDEED